MAKRFIGNDEGVIVEGADGSSAVPAGYVGETIRASRTTTNTTSGSHINVNSVTLTPGVWIITFSANYDKSTSNAAYASHLLTDSTLGSDTLFEYDSSLTNTILGPAGAAGGTDAKTLVYRCDSSKTVSNNIFISSLSSGTAKYGGAIVAVRIA